MKCEDCPLLQLRAEERDATYVNRQLEAAIDASRLRILAEDYPEVVEEMLGSVSVTEMIADTHEGEHEALSMLSGAFAAAADGFRTVMCRGPKKEGPIWKRTALVCTSQHFSAEEKEGGRKEL